MSARRALRRRRGPVKQNNETHSSHTGLFLLCRHLRAANIGREIRKEANKSVPSLFLFSMGRRCVIVGPATEL